MRDASYICAAFNYDDFLVGKEKCMCGCPQCFYNDSTLNYTIIREYNHSQLTFSSKPFLFAGMSVFMFVAKGPHGKPEVLSPPLKAERMDLISPEAVAFIRLLHSGTTKKLLKKFGRRRPGTPSPPPPAAPLPKTGMDTRTEAYARNSIQNAFCKTKLEALW